MNKNITIAEINQKPNKWVDPKTGIEHSFYQIVDEEGQRFDMADWIMTEPLIVGDHVKVIYATSTTESNGKSYTNHRVSKCSKLVSDSTKDIKTSPQTDKAQQNDFRNELIQKIDAINWKLDTLISQLLEKSIE